MLFRVSIINYKSTSLQPITREKLLLAFKCSYAKSLFCQLILHCEYDDYYMMVKMTPCRVPTAVAVCGRQSGKRRR